MDFSSPTPTTSIQINKFECSVFIWVRGGRTQGGERAGVGDLFIFLQQEVLSLPQPVHARARLRTASRAVLGFFLRQTSAPASARAGLVCSNGHRQR